MDKDLELTLKKEPYLHDEQQVGISDETELDIYLGLNDPIDPMDWPFLDQIMDELESTHERIEGINAALATSSGNMEKLIAVRVIEEAKAHYITANKRKIIEDANRALKEHLKPN